MEVKSHNLYFSLQCSIKNYELRIVLEWKWRLAWIFETYHHIILWKFSCSNTFTLLLIIFTWNFWSTIWNRTNQILLQVIDSIVRALLVNDRIESFAWNHVNGMKSNEEWYFIIEMNFKSKWTFHLWMKIPAGDRICHKTKSQNLTAIYGNSPWILCNGNQLEAKFGLSKKAWEWQLTHLP